MYILLQDVYNYDQYLQQWSTDIRASQKADVYCMIKSNNNLEIEKYITVVKNNCHRITLTRIRCSAHKLMIEEGRYRNIDRNQRFLYKMQYECTVIENEFHFVLVCPFYRQLRNECLTRYYCHWPSLFKFKRLMMRTNNKLISKVAKFVYLVTRLRG